MLLDRCGLLCKVPPSAARRRYRSLPLQRHSFVRALHDNPGTGPQLRIGERSAATRLHAHSETDIPPSTLASRNNSWSLAHSLIETTLRADRRIASSTPISHCAFD
jgi:hypothetical protein